MTQVIQIDPKVFQNQEAAPEQAASQDNTNVNQPEEVSTQSEAIDPLNQEQPEFDPVGFIQSQIQSLSPEGAATESGDPQDAPSQDDEPINAYKWAEKTGRNPQEFFELTKDWKKEEPETVVKAYLKEKNPGLTDKEIDYLYNKDYAVEDEEDDIEKSINMKKELNAAYQYFDNLQSEMGLGVKKDAPKMEIPEEYQTAYQRVQEFEKLQKEQESKFIESRTSYLNKVMEFHPSLEKDGIPVGFETELNGVKKEVSFKFNPNKEDMKRVLEVQSDMNTVFMQFGKMDENGNFQITDHNKLFQLAAKIALIDKYEKFIYEQGAADMAESLIKNDLKRPDYQGRAGRQAESAPGFVVRKVEPNKGTGFKMNL